MKFEKDKTYLCLKDVIIDKILYFKTGCKYQCKENDYLINCNKVPINMVTNAFEKQFIVVNTELDMFKSIVNNMVNTYEKKSKDYGNSFEKTCDKYGIVAALTRMEDKMNRLEAVTKNKETQVKNETIQDTLLDLANYSILTYMWLNKNNNNE